jgi:hypothetical protein
MSLLHPIPPSPHNSLIRLPATQSMPTPTVSSQTGPFVAKQSTIPQMEPHSGLGTPSHVHSRPVSQLQHTSTAMRGQNRSLVDVAGLQMVLRILIVLRTMGGRFILLILEKERKPVIRIIIVFLVERGMSFRFDGCCRSEENDGG